MTGWTVLNQYVAWGDISSGDGPAEGTKFLDMSGFGAQSPNSAIEQVLNTVNGVTYEVSLQLRGSPSEVSVDGNLLNLVAGSGGTWTEYTATFVATSNASLFTIANGSPGALIVFVDDVSVEALTAVPVPAAAWLFASGLAGLTGLARRNRRRAQIAA